MVLLWEYSELLGLNRVLSHWFNSVVESVPLMLLCLGTETARFSHILDMCYHPDDCCTIGCSLVFQRNCYTVYDFQLKVGYPNCFFVLTFAVPSLAHMHAAVMAPLLFFSVLLQSSSATS